MPPRERQHEGLGGLGDSFAVGLGPLREHVLTTGVVRHACRHRVTARGVFGLGDCFTRSELGNDIGLMGALLPFVLRACCGSMCWPVDRPANRSRRWSGSTRGYGGIGGFFHALRSGQTRMPPQSDGTRGFWFREIVSHALPRPPAPFLQTPTHPHPPTPTHFPAARRLSKLRL